MKRQLDDRIEEYESEVRGRCTCGQRVVKVIGSSVTSSIDKVRYRYPHQNTAWNIFRCKKCLEVIEANFIVGE